MIQRTMVLGRAELDLQRRVLHRVVVAQRRHDAVDELVAGMAGRHHQMRGQRVLGGRQRPHVQIVDIDDARLTRQIVADARQSTPGGTASIARRTESRRAPTCRPRSPPPRAGSSPGRSSSSRCRESRGRSPRPPPRCRRRPPCAGRRRECSGLPCCPRMKSHAEKPFTTTPIVATTNTVEPRDRRRVQQAPDRFEHDRAAREQQQPGIDERGEDRRAAIDRTCSAPTDGAWRARRRPRRAAGRGRRRDCGRRRRAARWNGRERRRRPARPRWRCSARRRARTCGRGPRGAWAWWWPAWP